MTTINNTDAQASIRQADLVNQILGGSSQTGSSVSGDSLQVIRPLPLDPSHTMTGGSGAAEAIATALPAVIKNIFNGVIRMFDHMAKFVNANITRANVPPQSSSDSTSASSGATNAEEQGTLDKVGSYIDQASDLWDKGSSLAGKVWDSVGGLGGIARGWLGKAGGLVSKGYNLIKKLL